MQCDNQRICLKVPTLKERKQKNKKFKNLRKFPQTEGPEFPNRKFAQERDENIDRTRHIIVKFQSIKNKSFQKLLEKKILIFRKVINI